MPKYEKFRIGDLFDIFTGRDVIIGRTLEGSIPLISHQHDNNGISTFVNRLNERILFNAKKTIALADRGVFWASVQNQDFHIGTRVKALVFKDGAKSREIRLFFATAINKLQILFADYLTNATDKLPDLEISLPVTADGEIDFAYMESYICEMEVARIRELETYLKVTGLSDYKLTDEDLQFMRRRGMIKCNDFRIGKLFDISTPKKKFNANTLTFDGKYRYIARGESDNGIRGYIDEHETYLNSANTISFGQDTATMFFQNEPYFTGDKIKIFTLLESNLTCEIALYLIAVMKKAFTNFGWGKSFFNVNVLKEVKISLPITADGSPDYEYMTRFIHIQQKLAIKNVAEWKNRELSNFSKP